MSDHQSRLLNEDQIAVLFNGMAEEYDQITDLWYAWLFCRLHYFLVRDLASSGIKPGGKSLDVGCGTGFQSVLLNLCGHDVIGIDLSSGLLEQARRKVADQFLTNDFFQAQFSFVPNYSHRIRELARSYRGVFRLGTSEFRVASATKLPFADESFDVVNCCGSTLSFIEDYPAAIGELVRVLRRGGLLFIEVENKYNLDLLWAYLDAKICRGCLGYEQNLEKSASNLFSGRLNNVKIDYPFSTKDGQVDMPIWLFSSATLLSEFSSKGIIVNKIHSVHSMTNLIPSVTLDEAKPSALLKRVFGALASIEEGMASLPLFRRLGCSLILAGTKH